MHQQHNDAATRRCVDASYDMFQHWETTLNKADNDEDDSVDDNDDDDPNDDNSELIIILTSVCV